MRTQDKAVLSEFLFVKAPKPLHSQLTVLNCEKRRPFENLNPVAYTYDRFEKGAVFGNVLESYPCQGVEPEPRHQDVASGAAAAGAAVLRSLPIPKIRLNCQLGPPDWRARGKGDSISLMRFVSERRVVFTSLLCHTCFMAPTGDNCSTTFRSPKSHSLSTMI